MRNSTKFYIDGEWTDPVAPQLLHVINPATETSIGQISMGTAQDVDCAVAAATRAFPAFSQTSVESRIELIEKVVKCYKARLPEISKTISMEMGAPISFSRDVQAALPLRHFEQAKIGRAHV